MKLTAAARLTKSDFLRFCEAPRHLWAKKHGQMEKESSDFEQHLADQGNQVEALAWEYFSRGFGLQHPGDELFWQQTYSDGPFEARLDGLVLKAGSNRYDLYEVKSSTAVKQENVVDVAFQAAILEKQMQVDHYFVLHLNKEYVRSGDLNLAELFTAEDITGMVRDLIPEVEVLRQEALRVMQLPNPEEAGFCLSPKECPCPSICHPDLPDFSIYDIPRLSREKKIQLIEKGIRAAKDIPASFGLNSKQRLVVERAVTQKEHMDRRAIAAEFNHFRYPLYFLDYETCISAIPPYAGYRPQQQIVFQYSLHKLERPGSEPTHAEAISLGEEDPALPLLARLREDIGDSGTVLVWNKTFEKSRNAEMAALHPEYAAFLEQLNERIYDLGDIISLGYYLHPGFKGSWSIKQVLPVMVPELSYEGMVIGEGGQASTAWWKMTFGQADALEKEQLTDALLRYCEQDTLGMVEIYRRLVGLIQ